MLLLMLVFGIAEFSRAWMTKNVLTSAAREGARLAVVTEPDVDKVEERVEEVCAAGGIVDPVVTVTGPEVDDPERRVTVTVRAGFKVLTGEILGPLSGTIPMSATSVMRHES